MVLTNCRLIVNYIFQDIEIEISYIKERNGEPPRSFLCFFTPPQPKNIRCDFRSRNFSEEKGRPFSEFHS